MNIFVKQAVENVLQARWEWTNQNDDGENYERLEQIGVNIEKMAETFRERLDDKKIDYQNDRW